MAISLDKIPFDLLEQIGLLLDVRSFVALTSTCRRLAASDLADCPRFWAKKLASNVRLWGAVPPSVGNDRKFYRRMFRLHADNATPFSWGRAVHITRPSYPARPTARTGRTRSISSLAGAANSLSTTTPTTFEGGNSHDLSATGGSNAISRSVGLPAQMADFAAIGPISDLQCGGFGVFGLTVTGRLYRIGGTSSAGGLGELTELVADPPSRFQAFSAGRSNVLAISQTGSIVGWAANHEPGYQVALSTIPSDGRVVRVVAGWAHSSAYVARVGIVIWNRAASETVVSRSGPATVVGQPVVVPGTNVSRPSRLRSAIRRFDAVIDNDDLDRPGRTQNRDPAVEAEADIMAVTADALEMGRVVDYVLLEAFVVFLTDRPGVYAAELLLSSSGEPSVSEVVAVTLWDGDAMKGRATSSTPPPTPVRLQGSFRNWSVIFDCGKVAIFRQQYLAALFSRARGNRTASPPPPLDPFDDALAQGFPVGAGPVFPDLPGERATARPEESDSQFFSRMLSRDLICYPAHLQDGTVVSIAFGDYHAVVLHSNGSVSSLGHEPMECAALGFGRLRGPGRLRGLHPSVPGASDAEMLDPNNRIWFDSIRHRWLAHLSHPATLRIGNRDTETGKRRNHAFYSLMSCRSDPIVDVRPLSGRIADVGNAMYDWLWSLARQSRTETRDDDDDKVDNPHFAVSVAAGGWTSAAMVFIDQGQMNEMVNRCYPGPHIPTTPTTASATSPVPRSTSENTAVPLEDYSLERPSKIRTLYDPFLPHDAALRRPIWDSDSFPALCSTTMSAAVVDRWLHQTGYPAGRFTINRLTFETGFPVSAPATDYDPDWIPVQWRRKWQTESQTQQ